MQRFSVAMVFSVLLCIFLWSHVTDSCNEAVCASIVSKCMITQSCKCELKTNCSCCKECFHCLNYLYTECCSCVDMCPKQNYTPSALSKKSHVEDLPESLPDLFQVLTAEPDTLQRWITVTFPVDFDLTLFKPKLEKEIKYKTQNIVQEVDPTKDMITFNCSVAYMSQCMSWNKCKGACQSMGAASYRWFHDGCCECIGDKCINYGINESRCLQCPLPKEVVIDENVDHGVDYGLDYGDEEDSLDM